MTAINVIDKQDASEKNSNDPEEYNAEGKRSVPPAIALDPLGSMIPGSMDGEGI